MISSVCECPSMQSQHVFWKWNIAGKQKCEEETPDSHRLQIASVRVRGEITNFSDKSCENFPIIQLSSGSVDGCCQGKSSIGGTEWLMCSVDSVSDKPFLAAWDSWTSWVGEMKTRCCWVTLCVNKVGATEYVFGLISLLSAVLHRIVAYWLQPLVWCNWQPLCHHNVQWRAFTT